MPAIQIILIQHVIEVVIFDSRDTFQCHILPTWVLCGRINTLYIIVNVTARSENNHSNVSVD